MHCSLRTLLFLTSLSAAASPAQSDLIINPGNDLPLVNGEIAGWTEVVGSNWTRRTMNPGPQGGDAYFFAGAGSFAELAQTIDVSLFGATIDSGMQRFDFSGYVRSFSQTSVDSAQIILEFEDSAGMVLDSFDSGQIRNGTSWQLVTDSRFAPANTRQLEIRLRSERNFGTNNDGYFDSLSLTTTTVPEPHSIFLTAMATLGFAVFRRKKPSSVGQVGQALPDERA